MGTSLHSKCSVARLLWQAPIPLCFLILVLLLTPWTAFGQTPQNLPPSFRAPRNSRTYVPDRVLVRFRPGRSPQAKANAHSITGGRVRISYTHVPDLELVDLPSGSDVIAAIGQYRRNPDVLYAEPDFLVYPSDVTPNDPLFSYTWGLQNLGDQNGVAGADIHATLAWQFSTGNRNVVVGDLDTGLNYNHTDLIANIYQNSVECNSNGLDNDGNGYINDCHGIDLVGDDSQNDPFDYIGHGTHTAGTMGAQGNNGIGVTGVNWQVSILPCKFIGFDGGAVSAAVQCLDYMAWMKEHGVNIVATNNSWGGGGFSQALYDAIEGQMEDGILFIAAAGNGDIYDNSSDNDVNAVYPASFDLPNIIAVAATDRRDNLAWFSNYGVHSVHLGAPGVSVLSTFGNAYEELSGTSMGTPHVTGSAALLKAFNPALDWISIKNLLMAGGDPNPNLASTVTQNRLNVYGAMTCSNRQIMAREEPRNNLVTTSANTPILLRVLHINCADPAGPAEVNVQPSGQVIELLDDGNAPDLAANDGVYSGSWTPTTTGLYTLNFPSGDNVTVAVLAPYSVSSAASTYVPITGTNLELNDETSKPIDTPFPVHFGGQVFSRLYVTDNGLIAFDNAFNSPVPYPLPDFETGALVAPFWDDFWPVFGGADNVFWDVAGTAPNRQLIVEWRNVSHYPFSGPTLGFQVGTVTFEVVFHEDRDEVDFNYGTFVPGDPWGTTVVPPAIWIQTGPLEGTSYNVGNALTSGTSLVWQLSTGTSAPDFTVALDAPVQTVLPGQLAAFTGSLKLLSGFSSPVTVSCAGAVPPSCGSTTVAAISGGTPFSVDAAGTTVGTYSFQLVAQSDDPPQTSHQMPVTLNVVNYAISAPSPALITVPDGGSGTFAVNLSASGPFSGPVVLSCNGVPAGTSCSFSPVNPVNLTSSTVVPVVVSLTVSPNTPLADYSVRVVASASGTTETREQVLILRVQANPDFLLIASGEALRSVSGTPAYGTFGLTAVDGYSGTVAFSCSVAPTGPSCVLTPTSTESVPSEGALEIDPNNAPTGEYQITLTATDSVRSHSVKLSYTIANPSFPFSFFLGQRTEQTVLIGNTTAPYDLIFVPSPSYFLRTQIVPWTCNPAGAICNITPSDTFTPNGSPVHLQMTVTVPVQDKLSLGGTFSFTALAQEEIPGGNNYPLTGTPITIHVQDYALEASTTQFELVPGFSTQIAVTNDAFNGFNLPVTVTCPTPLPPAVSCSVDKPILNPGDIALFTFSAGATAPPSFRELDIVGVATASNDQTIQHTIVLYASISVPTMSIDPASITVAAGGYANYLVTLNNFDAASFPVTCTSTDPGITCDGPFVTNGVGEFAVTVRTASGVTPTGTHPFTVSLAAWGETVSVSGTIVIQGADNINMVSPIGGELWSGGSQNIVWKYSGNPGSTVRLDLVNNGTFTQTIAASVPIGSNGGGSYSWQIPDSLPFSEFYKVRITSNDNPSITDSSEDPVWIGKGVRVHFPTVGSVIYDNGSYISVEYGWSAYGQIQFDLYKGGEFVQTLVTTQISGCFDFDPGCVWDANSSSLWDFPPGTDYSIKATPLADPTRAVFSSGTFTISNTSITLTSPNGGEVWQPGTTHAITWTWIGQPISPGVDVELTLGSSAYPNGFVITPTTPIGSNGSGSYQWSIPSNLPPANNYRVGIQVFAPFGNGVSSGSAADFAIGNFHKLSTTVNGPGTVQTSDLLINCPLVRCTATYLDGTIVTLIPSANGGVFLGWSGACLGTGNCTVTVAADLMAIANFAEPYVTLSAAPTSNSILAGQQAQYTIGIAPQGSLNATVSLTCGGLPQRSSCIFQPNNFAFPQSIATSVLTISTTATSAVAPSTRYYRRELVPPVPWLLAVLALGLFRMIQATRGHARMQRIWFLSIILIVVIGCGGGEGSGGGTVNPPPGQSPGTPAGSYPITVSAQVGSDIRTTTVTLVVQ